MASTDTEIVALLREINGKLDALLGPQPPLDAEDRRDLRLVRLAQLESQLADRDPGERAAAIRERMGVSKATYYRLRTQLLESQ